MSNTSAIAVIEELYVESKKEHLCHFKDFLWR